jgi:hypothetical protein
MIVSKWLRFSTLGKNGQIKRILAKARDADADDLVMLARVSSNDIASIISKIKTIIGVTKVHVASRHSGEPERFARLACLEKEAAD